MRLLSTALCTTVAVALLAGCSGLSQSTPSTGAGSVQTQSRLTHDGKFIPHWSFPASVVPESLRGAIFRSPFQPLHQKKKHAGGSNLYVTEFEGSDAYCYAPNNWKTNGAATGSTGPVSYVNGQAVDGKGNFIDPDGGTRTVIIFSSPCGSELGSFSDTYGQPSDASSADAATGTIAVGNIFDNSGEPGSISVCTLSGGCTANLTNSNMYEVAGVAMDNNGNCWASATNSAGTATLTYFAGCTGSGEAATGYENSYYGGLDIDKNGNLVSISAFNSELYVYSGCNPACTVVGGPFALYDEAVFGHLDRQSMSFSAGDFALGQVDTYSYSPSALTFLGSFNNGLTSSYIVEGASYNPRSAQ